MSKKTSIILPTFNHSAYTIECVKSIAAYTDPDKYQIIWVDNGSDKQEFREALAGFEHNSVPKVVIQEPYNKGFIKAVNHGLEYCLKETDDPYIIIQNNDTEVEPLWLDKLLEVFEEKPKAGLVGPTTVWADSWQNRKNLERYWQQPWPKIRKIDSMLAFFCTAFKREVFETVGCLDESYGFGFGDDDAFCEEAKKAGYELYLRTDVTVPHYHRTTFKSYVPDWEKQQKRNIEKFKAEYN